MVILIDEKNLRQEVDYYWDKSKFQDYDKSLLPIYTLEELEKKSKDVFTDGNVILYHESFLDKTKLKTEAAKRRQKMEDFIEKNPNSYLVLFSGSKSTRDIQNRVASLPVTTLYENLETFLSYYVNGIINLNYLLYGENHEIEKILDQSRELALKNLDSKPAQILNKRNLFISTDEKYIENPIVGCVNKEIVFQESDIEIHDLIMDWCNEETFDNIFVPICFGSSLSDFNGLRFATHLRCTKTKSQFANIFIYSFVELSLLLNNKYFNILRTKNIKMLGYKKLGFEIEGNTQYDEFVQDELSHELDKLYLKHPQNYLDDNHSIANVWGVFQLARNANVKIEDIKEFEYDKLKDPYFKWLIAKNNLSASISEEQKQEQKKYSEKLIGVKVVDKIDLSKIKRK
jgi:hypothetical protein